jgi:uncharacterized protein
MNQDGKLNYVEFAARDLVATKLFFTAVFGWQFVDYGPDYTAFSNQGLDGGFFTANACSQTATGGALLVFYSANIEATLRQVESHGGDVIQPVFSFPGGVRFHFLEPSGNEFAVWSEAVLSN